jgi:hypothetical protein
MAMAIAMLIAMEMATGDGYPDDSLAAIGKVKLDLDDPNSVYVGLRVYTHKDVQVEITSRLLGDD